MFCRSPSRDSCRGREILVSPSRRESWRSRFFLLLAREKTFSTTWKDCSHLCSGVVEFFASSLPRFAVPCGTVNLGEFEADFSHRVGHFFVPPGTDDREGSGFWFSSEDSRPSRTGFRLAEDWTARFLVIPEGVTSTIVCSCRTLGTNRADTLCCGAGVL